MRRLRAFLMLLGGLFFVLAAPGAWAQQDSGGRFYPQTGLTMAAEFIHYYDTHGGVALFGYPITAATEEDGLLVQYFERERFEYHPENKGTDFEVLLGRLGAELTDSRSDGPFAPVVAGSVPSSDHSFIRETSHTLGGLFRDYWAARGGVSIFGYPISEEYVENGILQQWFERARFEYHPELPADFRVSLGLLGRELITFSNSAAAQLTVGEGTGTPRHLQVDLSQGGESPDPHFLDNVIPQLQALKPSQIVIDNIYTHYDVIHRNSRGLSYDWSRLDGVVQSILATGAKPFFNLSYMPKVLSGFDDNIHPPQSWEEWRAVTAETVKHYNVDLNVGAKYWEVWNEPDQAGAWLGSFPDYLRLYDEARQGVRGVDNNAVVGGPARGKFDASALDWLASYQPYTTGGGYVGFLSWHSFGVPMAELADQVGAARAVIEKYPGWHPEIFVDALNVKTGGPGDTSEGNLSDTSAAASHILASLDTLEKAGADRVMIFEPKDGERPGQEFWGRWGLLTYNGLRKPAYHALQAYQSLGPNYLPVQVSGCSGCGLIASPNGNSATLLLWNNETNPVRVRVNLPSSLANLKYTINILDSTHNNPAAGYSDELTASGSRSGKGLVFDMEAQSVIILQGQ